MRKYLKILLFSLVAFMGCEDAVDGVDGENGLPIMVSVSEEPSGDNCANGGSKVSFGYDNNANGTLDATEVTDATFICNGSDGQNGNDGADGRSNIDVKLFSGHHQILSSIKMILQVIKMVMSMLFSLIQQ